MSDGSAFTTRTSSPLAVYRSTRDTRNSLLWNPSSEALLNTEEDEAGRLASFRARFGTAFDVSKQSTGAAGDGEPEGSEVERSTQPTAGKDEKLDDHGFGDEDDNNLLELISSYGQDKDAGRGGKKGGKYP